MSEEKKQWWKVRPMGGGSWLFIEHLAHLRDVLDGDIEAGLTFELVSIEMTEAEVEALGEFDGW